MTEVLAPDINIELTGRIFISGEIHLTPLKGVIQLRPSFEYLDRSKEKKPDTNDEGSYRFCKDTCTCGTQTRLACEQAVKLN